MAKAKKKTSKTVKSRGSRAKRSSRTTSTKATQSMPLSLQKEFSKTLAKLQNSAHKQTARLDKQFKKLKAKLAKSTGTTAQATAKQLEKIAKALNTSEANKQKLSEHKKALQQFDTTWKNKQPTKLATFKMPVEKPKAPKKAATTSSKPKKMKTTKEFDFNEERFTTEKEEEKRFSPNTAYASWGNYESRSN